MSFQDLQNDAKAKLSSSSSSSSSATARIASSQNPSQAVAAAIFQINTAVAGFRRLVDAIGTAKDTSDHRQKLHNSRQRILQLVKDTSVKLKSLSDSDRAIKVNPGKRIEDAKLARDFQSTLQEFQKVQQLASERESTYAPSNVPSSVVAVTSSGELLAARTGQENQPFLMEQKRQELLLMGNEIAFNESIIEEREQGIREIQEQIVQTSDIFKDLAMLVHDQGIVIDDIQSNIEASTEATTHARTQLSKASKSVKSKCSWCWWLLAIFLLLLIIVLVVLIL